MLVSIGQLSGMSLQKRYTGNVSVNRLGYQKVLKLQSLTLSK